MKLSEYKTDSYEFSGRTSDLIRQFAFAGIGIIWIFKNDQPLDPLVPQELFVPLLCLIITLAFDLFQYLFPTIIYSGFFYFQEKKNNGNTDVDVKAPIWFSLPGWICFGIKTITLIVAYIEITRFVIFKI